MMIYITLKSKEKPPVPTEQTVIGGTPVRFERMVLGVGAVLCEVFASQQLLKRRSSPTFCVVFACFLPLLRLPIFGGSSLVVAAVALAIL